MLAVTIVASSVQHPSFRSVVNPRHTAGMRIVAILAVLASSTTARADDDGDDDEVVAREPAPETPFDRGKMSLGVGGGSTSAFGERYFGIGAAFGYFVLDGVELGVAASYQFGDGPDFAKVAPQIRYVAQPLVGRWPLIPYAGVFYNHWFISDAFADIDTVGARTGLLYVSGRAVLGLGIAVEQTVSKCDEDEECTTYYPDLTIALSF